MTARVTFSPPRWRSASCTRLRMTWQEISSGFKLRPSASHCSSALPSCAVSSSAFCDSSAIAVNASFRERPISRLTEANVFCALLPACSIASSPTSIRASSSVPPSVRWNATTDGVVEAPKVFLPDHQSADERISLILQRGRTKGVT